MQNNKISINSLNLTKVSVQINACINVALWTLCKTIYCLVMHMQPYKTIVRQSNKL